MFVPQNTRKRKLEDGVADESWQGENKRSRVDLNRAFSSLSNANQKQFVTVDSLLGSRGNQKHGDARGNVEM